MVGLPYHPILNPTEGTIWGHTPSLMDQIADWYRQQEYQQMQANLLEQRRLNEFREGGPLVAPSYQEFVNSPALALATSGDAGDLKMPVLKIGGRPVEINQLGALSRADKFPDAPHLVFDVRHTKGYEGVFPTEDAARNFIQTHPNGKFLDHGTPREIEKLNPSGLESDKYLDQKLTQAVLLVAKANENNRLR